MNGVGQKRNRGPGTPLDSSIDLEFVASRLSPASQDTHLPTSTTVSPPHSTLERDMDSSSTEYHWISERDLGHQSGRTLLLGTIQSYQTPISLEIRVSVRSLTRDLLCSVGYEAEKGIPQILRVDPPHGYSRGTRSSPPSQFISISPLEYSTARHDRIRDFVFPRFAKKNKANVWRAELGNIETKKITAAYEHQRKVLSPSMNAHVRAMCHPGV